MGTLKMIFAIKSLSNFKDKAEMINYIKNEPNGPNSFVLKPQLEGGGNNYYLEEVLSKIEELSEEKLEAYILMDCVFAEKTTGMFFDGFKIYLDKVISEIGFYSWT